MDKKFYRKRLGTQGRAKTYWKVFLYGVFFVFLFTILSKDISAWSNTTFYNGTSYLSSEKLVFSGSEGITRWLVVPQNIWLSNGHFNLTGFSTDNITAASGRTYNTNLSGVTAKSGYQITIKNNDAYLQQITKNSTTTATKAYLLDSGKNVLVTATFSGNIATFSPAPRMNATLTYYVALDNNGAAYNYIYRDAITYPVSTTYLSYTGGLDANGNDNAVQADNIANITISVPAIIANITIGNQIITEQISGNGTTEINITTQNLATYINNYLFSCAYSSGFCQVPFNFTSGVAGNITYSGLNFNGSSFNEINQIFNNYTVSGNTETFKINVSYDNTYYPSISARLVYNNTKYSGVPDSTGKIITFSTNISIPYVSSSTKKQFYWEIILNNGTDNYINSTFYNQTVNSLALDDCSSLTQRIINYTIYDEDSALIIPGGASSNISFQTTLTLSSADGINMIANISINKSNVNSLSICAQNLTNNSLRLDALIKYSTTGYVTKFYNIQDFLITNQTIPINISLYDLLTTRSQEFLITLKDGTLLPIPSALIVISRYYPGEGIFRTVEIPITDSYGQTLGHFVLNTVRYKIEIIKNNATLYLIDGKTITCSDPNGNCELKINTLNSFFDLIDYTTSNGISYSPRYNSTMRTYYLDFYTTDGTIKTLNINITSFNSTSNNICTNTITASSGTLTCVIPSSAGNGAAIADITFPDGTLLLHQQFSLTSLPTNIPYIRYFLGFLMVVSIPLIAATSGPAMIIFFLLGIIFSVSLGLFELNMYGAAAGFIWVCIAGGILLWKMTGGRN